MLTRFTKHINPEFSSSFLICSHTIRQKHTVNCSNKTILVVEHMSVCRKCNLPNFYPADNRWPKKPAEVLTLRRFRNSPTEDNVTFAERVWKYGHTDTTSCGTACDSEVIPIKRKGDILSESGNPIRTLVQSPWHLTKNSPPSVSCRHFTL